MSRLCGKSRTVLLSTVACITVFAAPLGVSAGEATSQSDVSRALDHIAGQLGTSTNDVSVLAVSRRKTQLGRVLSVKAQNAAGEIRGINIDASGQPVRSEELAVAAENDVASKIHSALAEKLSGPQRRLRVMIWARDLAPNAAQQTDSGDARLQSGQGIGSDQQTAFAQAKAKRATVVATVVAPVLGALVKVDENARADSQSPVVYARLTPSQIQELGARPDVAAIYEDVRNKPFLDIALPTTNVNVVQARGINGSGVPLGVIEVGGRVATSNPYLAGVVQDPLFVCGSPSTHSTGVTGIVRSTHPTYKGVVPAANVRAGGSCGGWSDELQSRSTAAVDWGARALNLSWGANIGLTPGANDRFYDDMVMNRFVTVVVAAGNANSPCSPGTGDVGSPAMAYNVITVGNVDDMNTVSWTGDTMDACSSWRDPVSTHNDREKPEVSAPGSNIISTTTASPWTGSIGSGTSYAAPMITGLAGGLMQRNADLRVWPEAVKAIVMTSAIHNVEGSTRLSEFEGAGTMVADRADDIAALRGTTGSQGWNAQSYSCSAATTLDVATMSLTAGVPTRATIAWDQNPSYASYASQPSADLDLQIVNSANAVIASSASWDNTYEIVDFTPSATGTYKLRVSKFRCDLTPGWLGFAWRAGS